MKLPEWLLIKLKRWSATIIYTDEGRKSDFVPGPPMHEFFRRWWIIRPNRFFNIFLHYWMYGDQDGSLHNHSFPSISVILWGKYTELLRVYVDSSGWEPLPLLRQEGDVIFRSSKTPHRVIDCYGCISLFITGPRIRKWGFFNSNGDFLSADQAVAYPEHARRYFGIEYWQNPKQEQAAKK
jgi:hypothetical protein